MIHSHVTTRSALRAMCAVLALALGFARCTDVKEYYLDPAKPPLGIKILVLDDPGYAGDYLLVFSSENRGNTRFGGFLVFIAETRDGVMAIEDHNLAKFRFEGSDYNLGIDKPVAILFSNGAMAQELAGYSVVALRPKADMAPVGSWLTMRSYLIDDNKNVIELSSPGNPVQIP
ncbi:MAG TPA: hypothetical protein PKM65_05955 [Spirochaetota bacterium]|nr:hypothetical protein [Spirochaetota bacterium]HNT10100.1 hypothetical protein [Spirochaetota bacterium]HNV47629.1 hypothetical protein [Spirochaetota bacterium]